MGNDSSTHIMTVNGPVEPGELGIADAHSHLYIAPVPGGAADAPVLTDEEGIGRELRAFRAAGGGAIVDCQPGGCGRDGRVLRLLSAQSGILVVAATGFHRRLYYPPDAPIFAMSAKAAADYFREEIASGLIETRTDDHRPQTTDQHDPFPVDYRPSPVVYPGLIKIAAEASLEASPWWLLEAAAAVAKETGYAIEMHTERGAAVEAFLIFFAAQGLSPRRLVFCHVDKRPDFGLHRELAQAGVMLEYDTFFRPKYEPERNVWPLIHEMAAAGLAGQVALATDMADAGLWAELGGGPGLLGIFTIIKERLARMDLLVETIDGLLGGNIAARLAIEGLGQQTIDRA
jgi:phosphotriesterase-related protein